MSNTSSSCRVRKTSARVLAIGWPARLAQVEHGGKRLRDQGAVHQWREVDQPDAVRVAIQNDPGDRERQPCLADPAHAGQRQQPRGLEQAHQFGQLLLAPDEAAHFGGQVVSLRFGHPDSGGAGRRPADILAAQPFQARQTARDLRWVHRAHHTTFPARQRVRGDPQLLGEGDLGQSQRSAAGLNGLGR